MTETVLLVLVAINAVTIILNLSSARSFQESKRRFRAAADKFNEDRS